MAKQISDTAKYFPHDSNASAGDTLTALQTAFKNDGYAFWFRLLERLASANGHYLDMRNETKWETLAEKSHIDLETADKIMLILIKTEAIDVELWKEYRIIWCQNLVDNLTDVYRNRRREMPQRPIVKDGIITCSYGVDTCSLHVTHMSKETKTNEIKQNEKSISSGENIPAFDQIIEEYRQNIGGVNVQITGFIEAAYEIYGGEWISEAIKEACRQNKRTWAYIEGILRNWQQFGFKNPASRYGSMVKKMSVQA